MTLKEVTIEGDTLPIKRVHFISFCNNESSYSLTSRFKRNTRWTHYCKN